MADLLQVDIVTPERLVWSGKATEVRAPGWEGEFDILPGHALFLALLHGGVLTVQTASGEKKFAIGRGFAEAGPDRLTLLTDRCVAPESVDKERARKELSTAEEDLMVANGFEELLTSKIEERLEVARAMLEL